MGIRCGIVGLPNVGKSTLFNCLTKAGVEASNYPFCTIEPNVGVVPVPDPRLAALADIVRPAQVLHAAMEFVDIAGLVKGAAEGEGLGNRFLANIRETDAIAHVVRCFENRDIVHVAGRVSPPDDIEIINTELALADLESVTRIVQRLEKQAKSGDRSAQKDLLLAQQIQAQLNTGQPVRAMSLSPEEKILLKPFQLLTAKPVLYVANVDESGFTDNPLLTAVKQQAAAEGASVVAVCAALEAEMAELDESAKKEFLTDLGLAEPGLDRVIHAGYQLLNLDTYFTAGPKEVRAWTIKRQSTAPQAAGVIHSDFEKGFIRAEVISYADFLRFQGEAGAKEAGKWRLEGKDYIVQDGDVMHFRFNV